MEYRKLPHGGENDRFSVLGLGMGGIQKCSASEIEQIIRIAVQNGINFFDLCAGGKNVYKPFGKAISEHRDKVFFSFISVQYITKRANTAGQENFLRSRRLLSGSLVSWEQITPILDFCTV